MKKFFYMAVAAIAALSSCTNELDIAEGSGKTDVAKFTASIENGADTRATLAGYTPSWEAGDVISIDGHSYTADAAGSSQIEFTGSGATEATHHAYFPAVLYNGGTPSLPATYTYEAGKFNMPMYAESTDATLNFKNLCGVLAITIPSTEMTSVSSIEVKSDVRMNGAFTATSAGVLNFTALASVDADRKVTLTFSSAVTITSSETFYIPVPAGTHNPLIITVSDGTNIKSMRTTKADGIEVERNKIYPITFAENYSPTTGTAKATIGGSQVDVNWVQLWAGGPKFAEYNVGVTDGKAESYGGYYAWGGNQDMVDDHNTGTTDLTGDNDTATKLWGAAWRMPTEAELLALLANCDVEWTTVNGVNGRKYTGKDDYASNSVFLPAAGYCNNRHVYLWGDYGKYWSSTPYDRNAACYLFFHSSGQTMKADWREYGYSVRAVLAE